MANDEQKQDNENESDATERQRAAGLRRGERIPGKGFDSGGGYGGAGNSSAYSAKSSYGGQSGDGGSTFRGAYSGERYGRPDDELPQPDRTPPDDASNDGGFTAREGEFDPDSPLGGERREPGR